MLDLDISSGSQIVSGGNGPNITPIQAGQQVQLQAVAVPSAQVTNVQWQFDSPGIDNVVGNYVLPDNSTASSFTATPQPAPSSGNPITFYWVWGNNQIGGAGEDQHVQVSADVNGQPMTADVYYPVVGQQGAATAAWGSNGVSVDSKYPADIVNGTVTCPDKNTITVLSLGDPCTAPGISWTYGASHYTGGTAQVLQLVQATTSGIKNGQAVTSSSPTSGPGSPPPNLDQEWPYAGVTGTSNNFISSTDSPGFILSATSCTQVTQSMSFATYFMYKPVATASRPSIWVTNLKLAWKWAGTSTKSHSNWGNATNITLPSTATKTSPPFSSELPQWTSIFQSWSPTSC